MQQSPFQYIRIPNTPFEINVPLDYYPLDKEEKRNMSYKDTKILFSVTTPDDVDLTNTEVTFTPLTKEDLLKVSGTVVLEETEVNCLGEPIGLFLTDNEIPPAGYYKWFCCIFFKDNYMVHMICDIHDMDQVNTVRANLIKAIESVRWVGD